VLSTPVSSGGKEPRSTEKQLKAVQPRLQHVSPEEKHPEWFGSAGPQTAVQCFSPPLDLLPLLVGIHVQQLVL
jgi:hypothetical protein